MTVLSHAMILAAGLGTRMRPLTATCPKPLLRLQSKALLDHVMDRLSDAGVRTCAVNVHYLADQIEDHLRQRQQQRILISDERAALLDSGGGAKKMIPLMEGASFFLTNSDTVWMDETRPALTRMAAQWNAEAMDGFLLLAAMTNSMGYDGKGDFFCDADGRLARRQEQDVAPFVYAGVAILKPCLFDDMPNGPFSLNRVFDQALARRRLFGLRLDSLWMHVGTPQALHEAQALLRARER